MLVLSLLAAMPLPTESFQSTAVLDAIVSQFTGKAIGVEGGARAPVDKRLKLASCAAPQLEWRSEAKDAVLIRCMQPQWRIFVPVLAVAPSASQPLAPKQAPVQQAKPDFVIRRGDAVTVEVGAAGFSITRDGVAMSDAAAGGRLSVRIDERKPAIQAVAVDSGRARLPGWEM